MQLLAWYVQTAAYTVICEAPDDERCIRSKHVEYKF